MSNSNDTPWSAHPLAGRPADALPPSAPADGQEPVTFARPEDAGTEGE